MIKRKQIQDFDNRSLNTGLPFDVVLLNTSSAVSKTWMIWSQIVVLILVWGDIYWHTTFEISGYFWQFFPYLWYNRSMCCFTLNLQLISKKNFIIID